MNLPTRVDVQARHQRFLYELREDLGPVAHGNRFAALDVSSPFDPLPEDGGPPIVSLELLSQTDSAHESRLTERYNLFCSLRDRFLLALHNLGNTRDEQLVLVTEVWEETLAKRLEHDGGLPDAVLNQLFWTVSGGLFALHESGSAHGDLSPETIVSTPSGWKLAPGHPKRGASADLPADLYAVGQIFRLALGLPPIEEITEAARRRSASSTKTLPAPKLIDQARSGFGSWMEKVVTDRKLPPRWQQHLRRLLTVSSESAMQGEETQLDESSLPVEKDVPPGWRLILDGCLEPDPARRWTAARLLFGQHPIPVVNCLWIRPTIGGSVRVEWTSPPEGTVDLIDLGDHPAYPFGLVVGLSFLDEVGRTLRVPEGSSEISIHVNRESQRLQAITVSNERKLVIVGASVGLSRLADVTGLKARQSGGRLHLNWEWPEEIHLAYVVVRDDRFASSADEGVRVECLRTLYEPNGRFELPAPGHIQGRVFISVFAARRSSTGLIFSSGATAGARRELARSYVVLHYRVRPNPQGGFLLIMEPSKPTDLPSLLLVVGQGKLPLHRDDGTVVDTVSSGEACSPGKPLIHLFQTGFSGRGKAQLFCRSNEDYEWLELVSLPADGITIG